MALTLAGLLRDLKMGATVAPWEPGLRGGVYRVRHGRILLDHVAWVHGVRLTGTLLGRRERIRITGRVHGRLAGHGNRLSGTLAGRRVTMRMR